MKFRHEYKHIISYADMIRLRNTLSSLFSHDKNAGSDGTYYVKSLYFDNYFDKALREKLDGVDRREKFRIRYYGDDTEFIRLEKKSKIHSLCNKTSCQISKVQCQNIICGNISFMRNADSNLIKELYAKMHYQLLRPKCIVAYRRESFIYKPGNVRITLDSGISGSNNTYEFLSSGTPLINLYHNAILEVKWDEFLPSIVTDAVRIPCRQASAFSKYAAVRF